jgi:hypothetical protein
MRLKRWMCSVAALALSAAAGAQPAPDPVELVRLAKQADQENNEKARLYAYREEEVTREIDKNGQESNRHGETWDVIGLEVVDRCGRRSHGARRTGSDSRRIAPAERLVDRISKRAGRGGRVAGARVSHPL